MIAKSIKGIFIIWIATLASCASTPQKASAPVPVVEFRVAAGSCDNQDLPQTHWSQILLQKPQVWLWLGDNIYGDSKTPNVLEQKYKKLLNDPDYNAFRSQLSVTGTWDDHDFGENDGGASFPAKKKSKDLFWDFMQVSKDNVLRHQDGVYRSEIWTVGQKKVKLIILDSRYNRDPLKQNQYHEYVPTDGDMLGANQWRWFEQELAESADFSAVLVVNGTQVLSNQHRFEKWANFPKSRARLLKMMEDSPVKIKILLTGDRHFGEISEFPFSNGSKVVELTTSGLTHTYAQAAEPNQYRVGNLWAKTNYGLIDFRELPTGLEVKLSVVNVADNDIMSSIVLQ